MLAGVHWQVLRLKKGVRMKEIYDWVLWFRELGGAIAEGGERYLIEKAETVAWKADGSEPAILRYGDENTDPFSFVYTVASLNKSAATRNRVWFRTPDF